MIPQRRLLRMGLGDCTLLGSQCCLCAWGSFENLLSRGRRGGDHECRGGYVADGSALEVSREGMRNCFLLDLGQVCCGAGIVDSKRLRGVHRLDAEWFEGLAAHAPDPDGGRLARGAAARGLEIGGLLLISSATLAREDRGLRPMVIPRRDPFREALWSAVWGRSWALGGGRWRTWSLGWHAFWARWTDKRPYVLLTFRSET